MTNWPYIVASMFFIASNVGWILLYDWAVQDAAKDLAALLEENDRLRVELDALNSRSVNP